MMNELPNEGSQMFSLLLDFESLRISEYVLADVFIIPFLLCPFPEGLSVLAIVRISIFCLHGVCIRADHVPWHS